MGIIKEIIPTLKRRKRISEELQKVIRSLKKYQKITTKKRNLFEDDLFDWAFFESVCPK